MQQDEISDKETIMSIRDLVQKTRSYRRFKEAESISMQTLEGLVDLARQTASAKNAQPLRYVLVTEDAKRAEVFSTLGWAGYLPKWPGPSEGERPAAYIVVCGDDAEPDYMQVDSGIASQTILLGAAEQGLGCCMLGSVNREKLAPMIGLPAGHSIVWVLALGVPGEKVVMEKLAEGGDIKYWRDADETHHVPKRLLGDIVLSRYE